MLQPVRQKSRGGIPVSRSFVIPPAVGGWNARDSLDGMKSTDAVILDNFFPKTDSIELRRGFELFSTESGMTSAVETLEVHVSADGDETLIAASDGFLWNATEAEAVALGPDVNTYTSNRWQGIHFSDRLFLVNGVDDPVVFDGTTLDDPEFTGPTDVAALIQGCVFKGRLMFVENGTASFWYGDIGAVTGALSQYDLGQIASFGGPLMALGVITQDGGTGPDDMLACVMASGEILIYAGTDPSVAENWTFAGSFNAAPPLGRRCMIKMGSDLLILTRDGYQPLTQLLPFGRAYQQDRTRFSDKITGAITDVVSRHADRFGWQSIEYSDGPWMLVNVPTSDTTSVQHVMNTATGSWCRFTGINSHCWTVFGNKPVFGGMGAVYQADTGTSDNGASVSAIYRTSWTHLRSSGTVKQLKACQPFILASGPPGIEIYFGSNFSDPVFCSQMQSGSSSAAEWGLVSWGYAYWSSGMQVYQDMLGAVGTGEAFCLESRVSSTNLFLNWQSARVIFEGGNQWK